MEPEPASTTHPRRDCDQLSASVRDALQKVGFRRVWVEGMCGAPAADRRSQISVARPHDGTHRRVLQARPRLPGGEA